MDGGMTSSKPRLATADQVQEQPLAGEPPDQPRAGEERVKAITGLALGALGAVPVIVDLKSTVPKLVASLIAVVLVGLFLRALRLWTRRQLDPVLTIFIVIFAACTLVPLAAMSVRSGTAPELQGASRSTSTSASPSVATSTPSASTGAERAGPTTPTPSRPDPSVIPRERHVTIQLDMNTKPPQRAFDVENWQQARMADSDFSVGCDPAARTCLDPVRLVLVPHADVSVVAAAAANPVGAADSYNSCKSATYGTLYVPLAENQLYCVKTDSYLLAVRLEKNPLSGPAVTVQLELTAWYG